MRIFIIGAGAVGSALAGMLAKEHGRRNVWCGDRDPVRAGRFMAAGDGSRLVRVDASRPRDVARAAKGADLVVNAGLPDFNANVMTAALAAGAHYQDMCSHLKDLRHAEQLRFRARFKKAGRVALINTGVAPGLTNLLAADLADGFDRVRRIGIRLLEEQDAAAPVMSWSPRVIIDELSATPLVFRNGSFGFAEPFGDAETFRFPAPFGPRRVVAIYGDEVATIPLYLRVDDVDMKSGGTDIDFGAALHAAGMFGAAPVAVGRERIAPRDFFERVAPKVPTPAEMARLVKEGSVRNSWLLAAVEAEGVASGRAASRVVTAVFPDLRETMRRRPGATYVSYPTALCAAAFSKAIPRIASPGVIPPEALAPSLRRRVVEDLRAQGVRFVRGRSGKARGRRR
jgi:saccharopine dehydrogenase-like NADP-dependent oxidoreductase